MKWIAVKNTDQNVEWLSSGDEETDYMFPTILHSTGFLHHKVVIIIY